MDLLGFSRRGSLTRSSVVASIGENLSSEREKRGFYQDIKTTKAPDIQNSGRASRVLSRRNKSRPPAKDAAGSLFLEAAILLPAFLVGVLGMAELARFHLQKTSIENRAHSIAMTIQSDPSISSSDLYDHIKSLGGGVTPFVEETMPAAKAHAYCRAGGASEKTCIKNLTVNVTTSEKPSSARPAGFSWQSPKEGLESWYVNVASDWSYKPSFTKFIPTLTTIKSVARVRVRVTLLSQEQAAAACASLPTSYPIWNGTIGVFDWVPVYRSGAWGCQLRSAYAQVPTFHAREWGGMPPHGPCRQDAGVPVTGSCSQGNLQKAACKWALSQTPWNHGIEPMATYLKGFVHGTDFDDGMHMTCLWLNNGPVVALPTVG